MMPDPRVVEALRLLEEEVEATVTPAWARALVLLADYTEGRAA